jgi:Flp pilus assembly protein TadD
LHFSFTWDWNAAEAAFRRAIEIDPLWPPAHLMLGHTLSQMGKQAEASTAMRRARGLDPLSAMVHAMSSQVAFQARDGSAALDHARQAVVIDPQFWIGYVMRAQAHEQLGDADAALDDLLAAARFSGGNSKALSFRGHLLASIGEAEGAREIMKTLQAIARDRYVPPFALALVSAGLGESDAMFESLEQALSARDVHMIFISVDPRFDRYRADARFVELLGRCAFKGVIGGHSIA